MIKIRSGRNGKCMQTVKLEKTQILINSSFVKSSVIYNMEKQLSSPHFKSMFCFYIILKLT
jgi:hypothetical protein